MSSPNYHNLCVQEIEKKLSISTKEGLSSKEAAERIEKHGRNELPQAPKTPAWKRLLLQFHNVLIYILLAAAVITALMDHWIDTWVIIGVVLVNAWIGFVQEGKAEEALEGIRAMLSLQAIVRRDGHWSDIPAEDLVPGDIVRLKAGDKVPADLRLFQVNDLRAEEAALTGESIAVEKNTDTVEENAVLGDRKSICFSGTTITFGEGKGIVIATGLQTELGKINQMMAGVKKITTPLLAQIENFGKWLSVIIVAVSTLFFALGYFFRDYEIAELFLAVIGLIVASIPEGLPAIMTITLAIGVQRMASRNAIIRRLPSVETLGAVEVICSDKTGTLTRNEMTAQKIVTAEKIFRVEGVGYTPEGKIMEGDQVVKDDPCVNHLLEVLMATNNADVFQEEGEWAISGSPTEAALRVLCIKGGVTEVDDSFEQGIPFSSEHKYAAKKIRTSQSEIVIAVTGAPDNLLQKASRQYLKNGSEELDIRYWENQIEELATKGLRVLGAAVKTNIQENSKIGHSDIEGLTFIGLIGIMDPPREEAIEAVEACRKAGVQVKMITGDHAQTALAIAKTLGIGDGVKVITGVELEEKTDEELREIVKSYDVYARTSPEHKLRLVTAIQANGLRCAMTGDGVNDAPALKKADIGVAMGIKGTEVSKEAAEMVLADDNFASIVHAIEEGRTVYDNIRKSLLFMLPTNGGEALVIIAAILMGITMPITPAQILWVNMVTAVTLALALAFEPTEPGIMERKPMGKKSKLLGGVFLWRITFVSIIIAGGAMGLFLYLKNSGAEEELARTIAVNALVAGQLFYLFNCRTLDQSALGKNFFKNPYVFYAISALLLLQLMFVYAPFMNTFFGTQPLNLYQWTLSTLVGSIVFFAVEIEKWVLRTYFKKD